ncbi:MAG TPA: glycosyltransferase family 39 protein [Candidatus Acidoferrales bacterium]|nr:glycosyltransferase family 39 protein [Candidatus Acidoferrales bacterium]
MAMPAKTKYPLLVLLLALAIFLRFYRLPTTPPGLYRDEAINAINAVEAAATGHYRAFYPENNGREGLYVNAIALLFAFFDAPHDPWVVRLPAAVAGVLTVPGLYLLVAELLGDGPGLFAAFLLATSFWHINFSRIGFGAVFAPLLLCWALYFFTKAVRAADPRAAGWHAAFAGIVYGLGFYTYIAYRITPLLFLAFVPFFKRSAHFWRRAGVFVAAAFVVAAPLGWYFLEHPGEFLHRASEISVAGAASPVAEFGANAAKELLMFNVRGDSNWRHNISGAPELFLPVGLLFLVGIAIGIYSLERRGRDGIQGRTAERVIFPAFPVVLAFLWFFLALLPAALSDEGIPHALRSILMLPPAIILATMGGVCLYRWIKNWNRGVAVAAAWVFLIGAGAAGYRDYFLVWAHNPNVPPAFDAGYVETGREINALPASTPKYVVVGVGGVMVRGIPMPAETTMFITDTFTPAGQAAKNVHYVLPDKFGVIPKGTIPWDATVFIIR